MPAPFVRETFAGQLFKDRSDLDLFADGLNSLFTEHDFAVVSDPRTSHDFVLVRERRTGRRVALFRPQNYC